MPGRYVMRIFNNSSMIYLLCLSLMTLSVKTDARSFYVKNYSLPNYTEFHGKIKSGEFDEYHVFLQKSQSLRVEVSDKRFELSMAGPNQRGSKARTHLDKDSVFIAPASGMYNIIVKSTHRDQQCNCYVLAINFMD